jgi:hypothetical protein
VNAAFERLEKAQSAFDKAESRLREAEAEESEARGIVEQTQDIVHDLADQLQGEFDACNEAWLCVPKGRRKDNRDRGIRRAAKDALREFKRNG